MTMAALKELFFKLTFVISGFQDGCHGFSSPQCRFDSSYQTKTTRGIFLVHKMLQNWKSYFLIIPMQWLHIRPFQRWHRPHLEVSLLHRSVEPKCLMATAAAASKVMCRDLASCLSKIWKKSSLYGTAPICKLTLFIVDLYAQYHAGPKRSNIRSYV